MSKGRLSRGSGLARSGAIVIQDEYVIVAADTREQLDSTDQSCDYVWVGAPTIRHTAAELNDGVMLIGIGDTHAELISGAFALEVDDHRGFIITVDNVNLLYVSGDAIGDAVEYAVFG